MHQQAYSTFEIKSVDPEQRIIVGIASTPDTDRGGDEMDPKGAQFTLPMPFRWEHKSTVGEVFAAHVTDAGIEIQAKIATIPEPGDLQKQVDFAWQSIKHKLARGLSIGWKPITATRNKSGGLTVSKWSWLETSAVSIPMNAGATIALIKSLDLAASGTQAETPSPSAGASALSPRLRRVTPMNLSERITGLKAERKRIADRMKALMQPELDGTGAMDETQTKDYDTETANLKQTDLEIARFEALEQADVIPQAKALRVVDSESGSHMRDVRQIGNPKEPDLPPGIEFTRAVICKVAGRLFGVSPMEVARERYPNNGRIQAYFKSAVAGATTSDSTWAAPLVTTATTLTSEFLEYLRPMTIVGKFGTNGIPSLSRVPFNVRIQSQTSGGAAAWVGQGVQKPLTKFDYAAITLYWAKIAAISVASEELFRFSTPSAEGRIRDGLTGAIVERMDIDFINPWKGASANVSPASITNGIAAKTPTGTGDADDVRADVSQVLAPFLTANENISQLVWIMPAAMAVQLSLMRNTLGAKEFPDVNVLGGTFEGFPVITSQYATTAGSPDGNLVILVNAKEIFLADDGGVTVDSSREASLEMSDDPANDTGTIVSMYQTNQVALRAERYINWARARTSAVAWLQNVSWSATA